MTTQMTKRPRSTRHSNPHDHLLDTAYSEYRIEYAVSSIIDSQSPTNNYQGVS